MPLEIITTDEIVNGFPIFHLNTLVEKSKIKDNIFCNPTTGLSFLLRFIKLGVFNESVHYSQDCVSYLVKSNEQVLEILNGLGVAKHNMQQIIKMLYISDINETINDRPFYMTLQLRQISRVD